ncbi:MAG TPA: PAS domain S-box protein [Halomicronema sp.]
MTELSLNNSDITTLFNLSAEIFCIINPQGNFEKLNPVWQNLLGWTPQELYNEPWLSFIHPDDVAVTLNGVENSEPDNPSQFENRFQHKDGLYLWLRWKVLRDQTGTIFATATDITTIKRLHRQFSSQQQRLNNLFSSSSFGIAVVDKELRFLEINQTLADIHGIKPAQHLGKTYRQTLPHLAPTLEPLLNKVLRSRTKTAYSQIITTSDDPENKRYWQLTVFAIEESPQVINCAGILVTEITHSKKQEQLLQRRLALFEAVSQISTLLGSANFSPHHILKVLGEKLDVSRAYIFEFSADTTKINNKYEWCATLTPPLISEEQNLDLIDFSWWVEKLAAGETINIPDISTLPEEVGTAAAFLRGKNICSRLWVPIKNSRGILTGLIGFDALHHPKTLLKDRKTWLQKQEIIAIQNFSKILSYTQYFQEHKNELSRINRILKAQKACKKIAQNTTNFRDILQQTCHVLVEIGGYNHVCLCETATDTGNPTTNNISSYNLFPGLPMGKNLNDDNTAISKVISSEDNLVSVSLPLVAGEFNFGFLKIYSKDSNAFQEEEINALYELAYEITQAAIRSNSYNPYFQDYQPNFIHLNSLQNLNSWPGLSIPNAIFSTSLDGTYLDFLSADNFEPLIPPKQLIGKKISEVLPAPLGEKIIQILQEVYITGIDQTFEYQLFVNNQLRSFVVRSLRSYRNEVLSFVQERCISLDNNHQLPSAHPLILSNQTECKNLAISQLNEVVIFTDNYGNIMYIFPENTEFIGYSTDDIYGLENIQKLWGDNLVDSALLKTLGEIKNLEILVKNKRGENRHLLVDINLKNQESGLWIYVFLDLTELVNKNQQLNRLMSLGNFKFTENFVSKNSQAFDKFFDESFQGIAFLSRNGNFLKVNSKFIQILGYTEAELKNLTHSQITYLEDRETELTLYRLVFAGELPSYTMQKRYRKKNQEILWAIVKLCVIQDCDEKPLYALLMIEDITKSKNLEGKLLQLKQDFDQRLNQSYQQLEVLTRNQEQFCYLMAQNLQKSVKSINGFCEQILESYLLSLDCTGQDYIQHIRHATKRMEQLIEDVLLWSIIKFYTVQPVPVNLSDLATAITGNFKNSYSMLNVNCQITENLVTYGDNKLLHLLLEKLLSNSIKFTRGLSVANIQFGERLLDGKRTYFVSDNGVGFDMAGAEKIFTPFGRLHTETEFEGTGMGLAVAWQIVQRHLGKIWVESVPKKGTTFYFTLNL